MPGVKLPPGMKLPKSFPRVAKGVHVFMPLPVTILHNAASTHIGRPL